MSENMELFLQVLQQGIESGASDWHVKEASGICLRLSGEMVPLDVTPDHAFMEEVLEPCFLRISAVNTKRRGTWIFPMHRRGSAVSV